MQQLPYIWKDNFAKCITFYDKCPHKVRNFQVLLWGLQWILLYRAHKVFFWATVVFTILESHAVKFCIVFWIVIPDSLIDQDKRFRRTYYLHLCWRLGKMFLWNIDNHPPIYIMVKTQKTTVWILWTIAFTLYLIYSHKWQNPRCRSCN
jgi:hypothetical protein